MRFVCNCLRVAKENRLFAGLWYGSQKPDMSLFLKPLSQSLTLLYEEGMLNTITTLSLCTANVLLPIGTLVSPADSDPFVCRAVLIACTCDLPARALVMNFVQYNGFYGCSHCLQKG